LGKNTRRFPEGVEPQNQSQTWVPHPPSTHGRHREFDLDLKWRQSNLKKNQKNGKPAHGVMICHVVPRKNTNHGIPRFQRKTLHKKWHQAGLHLAFYPMDHGLCKFHRKHLNLDPIFGRDVYISKANNFCN
jgi:hypothetical protein